jgi:hypothetical protein
MFCDILLFFICLFNDDLSIEQIYGRVNMVYELGRTDKEDVMVPFKILQKHFLWKNLGKPREYQSEFYVFVSRSIWNLLLPTLHSVFRFYFKFAKYESEMLHFYV